MFEVDKPIENEEDDKLGRGKFIDQLGDAVKNWTGETSLVIGLYGEWGVGKTSILQLLGKQLEKTDNKPTVVQFFPWNFSGQKNIDIALLNELSKELSLSWRSEDERKIGRHLKLYARIINLVPTQQKFTNGLSSVLVALALLGYSSFAILPTNLEFIKWVTVVFAAIMLIRFAINFTKSVYEAWVDFASKPLNQVKNEIQNKLKKREAPLIITIDDIDRLTTDEIRQVIKLVRANSDFANVIFILSFDPKIVTKSLGVQEGVDGEKYLEKIVHVALTVPPVSPSSIHKVLFSELDKILNELPESVQEKYFSSDEWSNVFHSGYKNYFSNVRDVKRYVSSLRLTIKLHLKDSTLDVNLTDLFAIEAIRVFVPSFYEIMASNMKTFTHATFYMGSGDYESRKKAARAELIKKWIEEIKNEDTRSATKELLERLFPQVKDMLGYQNTMFSSDSTVEWNKRQHICSRKYYDSYFTLYPNGDPTALTQADLDQFILSMSEGDAAEIIKQMSELNKNGRLLEVLSRIQDYTRDEDVIKTDNLTNSLLAVMESVQFVSLLESSDVFNDPVLQLERIVWQLLSRHKDEAGKNFEAVSKVLESLKDPRVFLNIIAHEIQRADENKTHDLLFSDDERKKLHKIAKERLITYFEEADAEKINDTSSETRALFNYALFWKQKTKVKSIIAKKTTEPAYALGIMTAFTGVVTRQQIEQFTVQKIPKPYREFLESFTDVDKLIALLTNEKNNETDFYKSNKGMVDMRLEQFKKENLEE